MDLILVDGLGTGLTGDVLTRLGKHGTWAASDLLRSHFVLSGMKDLSEGLLVPLGAERGGLSGMSPCIVLPSVHKLTKIQIFTTGRRYFTFGAFTSPPPITINEYAC